ncbi:DinB family protein [Nitrincola sp. MINF-07-Sa-05]|uniref:DinB family protein n=1 Tax=Nitrincola salilacus TaxID=3400273 RepID=UPI003917CBEF
MFAAQAKTMASYNRWMNQRMYTVCAKLSDSERKKNCGAFFKSIHGTLNHLLLGDKIWLGRFLGKPLQVSGLDEELHGEFERLWEDRSATDEVIIEWASALTDTELAVTLEYTSIVNPTPRTYEMWIAVAHFFNHQTHHRGQITTLLSQFGQDLGVTDLIWLPEIVERNTT